MVFVGTIVDIERRVGLEAVAKGHASHTYVATVQPPVPKHGGPMPPSVKLKLTARSGKDHYDASFDACWRDSVEGRQDKRSKGKGPSSKGKNPHPLRGYNVTRHSDGRPGWEGHYQYSICAY